MEIILARGISFFGLFYLVYMALQYLGFYSSNAFFISTIISYLVHSIAFPLKLDKTDLHFTYKLIYSLLPILFWLSYLLFRDCKLEYNSGFQFKMLSSELYPILIAVVSEELIFRSYFFDVFRAKIGMIYAVIFSSAAFAIAHLNNDNFDYLAFVNTFLAGIAFALIKIRTGQVAYSIIAHFVWNFFGSVVIGAYISGIYVRNVVFNQVCNSEIPYYGAEADVFTTIFLILFVLYLNKFRAVQL